MALVGHMEAGQGPRRDAPHRPAASSVSSGRNTTVPKCNRVREKQGRREDEALSFWPLTRSRSLPFRSPSAGPAGSLARPAPRGPALAAGGPVPPGRRPHDDPTAARADPRLPPGARGPTLLCSAGGGSGKARGPRTASQHVGDDDVPGRFAPRRAGCWAGSGNPRPRLVFQYLATRHICA